MRVGIAVIGFNRPNHLALVLNQLDQSGLDDVRLYLDGPSTQHDVQQQQEISQRISRLRNLNVQVRPSRTNLGLRESILQAIHTELLDHDAVIVIEDDCLPSPNFLPFILHWLKEARDDSTVWSVVGYQVPPVHNSAISFESLAVERFIPWGWATWKDRWNHYPRTPSEWEALVERAHATRGLPPEIHSWLAAQHGQQESSTWSLGWILSHYVNRASAIMPSITQIENIGFDGSGTHTPVTHEFNHFQDHQANRFIPDQHTLPLTTSIDVSRAINDFFRTRWASTMSSNIGSSNMSSHVE